MRRSLVLAVLLVACAASPEPATTPPPSPAPPAPVASAPPPPAPRPKCSACARRKLERDFAAQCGSGGLTTAITFPEECVAMARLRCSNELDDADALARAGDHATASERFEALAFTPPQGCETSRDLAIRAVVEAEAADDLTRARTLRDRMNAEFGIPVVPHASPYDNRR